MGTSFANPIPHNVQPRFHEASPLRSLRDSDATPRVWQKNLKASDQIYRMTQAIEQLQRQLNRLRMRGGGTSKTTASATGMIFKGLWNNTLTYDSQNVVFYTPTGGSSSAFIALEDSIPIGTSPDTGAPYWSAWPYPPAGMWG